MNFFRVALSLPVTLALGATLAACSPQEEPAPQATSSATQPAAIPSEDPAAPEQEDVRAQIASVLMPPARDYDDALAKLEAGAGGIFIPGWADPALLGEGPRSLPALREAVGRDFAVSIDFEGGRVQRFSEILGEYPSPQQMAAQHSPAEVEQLAQEIGTTLHERGITVDFAPVLDVGGEDLDVVGDRSFSTDPTTAGEYGAAFARGLQAAGVQAVFKHFPGHGRASGDTHLGQAVTPPLGDLSSHEFVPFHTAIPQAPEAQLMMGHLVVPGLGEGKTPASINPAAYQLARSELNYQGIIYTDDLGGMASISDTLSLPEAAAAALAAGADMPLWSTDDDFAAVIDAVQRAVEDGRLSREHLEAAQRRVAGARAGEAG
ncbi:glycoside hydrolase family 3 N-terminal domain-containing protein [Corynebacterium sp.]|uniref:glycoside hydrolase family 3 N-terminal domain-containing protein n=1 Tax=Corynebacterium sp. TaxID=1720 RepID=UPI0026DDCB57|nr:glycoside hydrolase family 3 N-terminal domain-containing protein [Corynebacterium sp.]MDO5033190.1 glycoside hydrolase family 3 N-terminal domain-containing protein [Corynebacterium sp.]